MKVGQKFQIPLNCLAMHSRSPVLLELLVLCGDITMVPMATKREVINPYSNRICGARQWPGGKRMNVKWGREGNHVPLGVGMAPKTYRIEEDANFSPSSERGKNSILVLSFTKKILC